MGSINKPTIGWREWVELPELGVERIKAKIDTGARTSALHAFDIEVYEKKGQEWAQFSIQPHQKNDLDQRRCTCPVKDIRIITNSGGSRERRIVIETQLTVGSLSWPIELTLTNRNQMGFRMLLGRAALKDRLLVNPGRSFCLSGSDS